MPFIRILLVESNQSLLDAATHLLATKPGIEIVGRTLSGYDALEQMRHLQPDVVLLDLALPGMDALGLTRWIKAQPGAPYVIISTRHDVSKYNSLATAMGADGVISKSEFDDQVLPLIYALCNQSGRHL